ncbi:ABC-type nitrate/sulfonate/bicarbonate transport system permease component [Microbacteriaceae bacterium SG_E_30_P1]|uniref:ABC-type nitrate/sulfonate/bicarbonate transport system permease component n=1 Tax=Antiquaquibacter oligotrophicus TaxID=2880260 RepID=A0ABT6KPJ0_9MICO|nr:ABC transporter permease subunit [Antiquaquibacter oligotrophicus]MDH6181067.1 ABC-type nitrate/sulfonate/bicarbonate transport system permease component [Antiquaquibacter oligotrophicus]UDF13235.1 ABC transporter permease subunit [Antiquaquibacter oligotrophicus]
MRALPRPLIPAVFFVLLLVAWQWAGQSLAGPGAVLVPPSTIVETFGTRWYALLLNAGITLSEAGLGFVYGSAAAIVLAIVVDRFRVLGEGLYRLALVIYAIPVIAIAAPLTATLGLGAESKIAVAALSAYFPVLVNLTGALRTLDPRIDELSRVLAMGYTRTLVSMRAPAVVPALFSSFKIAGPAAFIGAIIAEWMGAEAGLGVMLIQAMFTFSVPVLWTVLVVATALNGLIVLLFDVAGRLAAPWHVSSRGEA